MGEEFCRNPPSTDNTINLSAPLTPGLSSTGPRVSVGPTLCWVHRGTV